MHSQLLNNWPFNPNNHVIKDRILKNAKTISLNKKQQFLINKSDRSGLYGISKGLAMIIVDDHKQSRSINYLRRDNEWFGADTIPFDNEVQYEVDLLVEAVESCELFYLSSNKVLELLSDFPDMDVFVYQYFAHKARETLLPATIIGTSNLSARICYFLLSVRQYYAEKNSHRIPLTQQSISELINVSRQKINQSLQFLVNNNAIALHRGSIEVIDHVFLSKQLLQVLPCKLPKHLLN